MLKLKNLFFPLLLICVTTLIGCNKNTTSTSEVLSRTELFMGTVVKITLYDSNDSTILDKAFDRVAEIESLVSINEAGTELDKVNDFAGISPVEVTSTTYEIVEKGLEYSKLSNGDFDITIGPLVKLWNIGLDDAKVPTQEEIDSVLPLIDYNLLELNKEDHTIFLKNKGMMIDLGSIAKGYAADEISHILTENNVNSAIIDLGGNIYAHGIKPSGQDWNIGIQNPFSTRGDIIGVLKVKNKTVVTSGIYERYIEKDGVKYHHLLNPNTGYPFENNIAGVSIITDKSIDADALSTTVFAKGLEEGLKFVETLPNVDAIFITKDNKVYITNGIRDSFTLENEDFTLQN
ncbi:MAG: FAD:protein FMN transferase [Clostridium sp.]|nr:FAD:protein FMN transferase [Clostridium sp.]